MPVQNYEWVRIHMASGYTFFMHDFDWDKKINAVGQYGVRFFGHEKRLFYTIHQETAEKIVLKELDNFGFNPNYIERYFIVRDKNVEVQ